MTKHEWLHLLRWVHQLGKEGRPREIWADDFIVWCEEDHLHINHTPCGRTAVTPDDSDEFQEAYQIRKHKRLCLRSSSPIPDGLPNPKHLH